MKLPWLIIAILGTISMLFIIISLTTPAWIVGLSSGEGLWQVCSNLRCISSSHGKFCHDCGRISIPGKYFLVIVFFHYCMLKDKPTHEVSNMEIKHETFVLSAPVKIH